MSNSIYEYYQAIQDGSVTAGKWIKLFYTYIIKGLEEKRFFFDQKKANRAIKFIETMCHHSEGRCDLLKLELWQKACVSVIFGIVDSEGTRIFREIFLVVARKNGKTLFAAAIIAYCAFLDGEYGAKIYCLAPKLDQADLVYSDFYQILVQEPELMSLVKKRKTDLYIESSNSTIKKIAFNAKKSDGFNPHLSVCDEVASWSGDSGLKQYEVMKSALGSRKQPLILSITTAGYVNDGIYDELMKRSTKFLMGGENNKKRESRLAPFLYIIDDVEKWNDINELQKSNPNLGVSVSVDYMLEEIIVAEGSLSKKAEFMTKYCNVKQNSSQAWLDSQSIEKADGDVLRLEDFSKCYAVGGIDLSQTVDLTACTLVVERNGKLYVFAKFFMPAQKMEEAIARDGVPYDIYVQRGLLQLSGDNFVDYHDCMKFFTDMVEKYHIYPLKIGYDRYSAQYLVQDMRSYGFHMDDVYQGTNLTPVIQEFEGMLKDGKICIGNNDLLKMHLYNAALKRNIEDDRVKLVKMGKYDRIDGVAALLDAMTVRQKWYPEIGGQLKNER